LRLLEKRLDPSNRKHKLKDSNPLQDANA
ncbi:ABC transporter permease, partial [Staphylococcus warneri]